MCEGLQSHCGGYIFGLDSKLLGSTQCDKEPTGRALTDTMNREMLSVFCFRILNQHSK